MIWYCTAMGTAQKCQRCCGGSVHMCQQKWVYFSSPGMAETNHRSAQPTLMGELRDVYCEDFGENRLLYNGTTLYVYVTTESTVLVGYWHHKAAGSLWLSPFQWLCFPMTGWPRSEVADRKHLLPVCWSHTTHVTLLVQISPSPSRDRK